MSELLGHSKVGKRVNLLSYFAKQPKPELSRQPIRQMNFLTRQTGRTGIPKRVKK
jgi:hypothetical protein